jgi:phosphatidylserine/phosphatidylglycerophosphate/cardiolipin synthase-like enzyme
MAIPQTDFKKGKTSGAIAVIDRIYKLEPKQDAWWAEQIEVKAGNELQPLVHGDSYYENLIQALERAGNRIYITGWVMEAEFPLMRKKGHPAHRNAETAIGEVLRRAALRGVDVRILVWHNLLAALEVDFDATHYRTVFDSKSTKILVRELPEPVLHQKSVVVDGTTAYCGGIDISKLGGDHWDTGNHKNEGSGDKPLQRFRAKKLDNKYWHDVQIKVTGNAVAVIERNFIERWQDAAGVNKPDRPFRSHLSSGGRGKTRVQVIRTIPPSPEPVVTPMDGSGGDDTFGETRQAEPYRSRNSEEYSTLEFYGRAIVNAQRFIYIENQYFTCDLLIELLKQRLQANKQLSVVVLLPIKSELSVPDEIQRQNRSASFSRAVAKEHIVTAQVAQQLKSIDSSRVFFAAPINATNEEIYVHAKVMIADDLYATVGSANFSERSMYADFELGVAWTDPSDNSIQGFREKLWSEHLGLKKDEFPNLKDGKLSIAKFWQERLANKEWKERRIMEWKPADKTQQKP